MFSCFLPGWTSTSPVLSDSFYGKSLLTYLNKIHTHLVLMRKRMVLVLIEKVSPSSKFHLDPDANFDLQWWWWWGRWLRRTRPSHWDYLGSKLTPYTSCPLTTPLYPPYPVLPTSSPLSPHFRDWLPPSLSVGGAFSGWPVGPGFPGGQKRPPTQEKCVSTQFAFHSEFGRLPEICRRMLTRWVKIPGQPSKFR